MQHQNRFSLHKYNTRFAYIQSDLPDACAVYWSKAGLSHLPCSWACEYGGIKSSNDATMDSKRQLQLILVEMQLAKTKNTSLSWSLWKNEFQRTMGQDVPSRAHARIFSREIHFRHYYVATHHALRMWRPLPHWWKIFPRKFLAWRKFYPAKIMVLLLWAVPVEPS